MEDEAPESNEPIETHPMDNTDAVKEVKLASDEGREDGKKEVEEREAAVDPKGDEAPDSEEESEVEEEEVDLPEDFKQYGELGKYALELRDSGEISEGSIKEITEKFKLPEIIVKEYIENAKAVLALQAEKSAAEASAFVASIHASVGGEEHYKEITKWAKANLASDEIETFNRMVKGNKAEAKLAVEGLKARFEKVHGQVVDIVQGKAVARNEGGYRDMEDYLKDLGDPRMQYDKAYRAAVDAKLTRSDLRRLKK